MSYELTSHGVEHVVLERGRIGQSWRDRWDSFCLVTPNWSVQLPDGAYDGMLAATLFDDDPAGLRGDVTAALGGDAAVTC